MLYTYLKTFHIIFFTTWIAGLFYLPRLFVYHASAKKNSSEYNTFIIMEKKLFFVYNEPINDYYMDNRNWVGSYK